MCNAVKSGKYPFVMCNFAPPDMVGHTGKYEPAIKGCEATGESTVLYNQLQHYDGYALEICQDEKASVFFWTQIKRLVRLPKHVKRQAMC